jgi:TetR/AcrR family transcriptional regulator, transcriptional repressor for nem operon
MVGVRQFDEDRVLATALDLFWRKGLRATSMLDLAEATGVQRGSLYNAYHGKETLFLMAFEGYAARLLQKVRDAVQHPDPARALLAFLDVGIASMAAGTPPRGCLTTKTATEPDLANTAVQRKLEMLLDDMKSIIASALSSSPARTYLVLNPVATAETVVTFSRGLAVMERVYQDPEQLRRSAAGLVQALVRPGSACSGAGHTESS